MNRNILLFGAAVVSAGLTGHVSGLDFVVDPTQSSATLEATVNSLITDSGTSALSSTASVELGSLSDPFGTTTITSLDITLDDGITLSYNLIITTITASTVGGDVSFSQVTPGSIDNPVVGGLFDQIGNEIGGTGTLSTSIGESLDLSTVGTILIDYEDVSISRLGDELTLSAPIAGVVPQQSFDAGISVTIDATVSGTLVATALVPEPASAALLGIGGLMAARRRRR